MSDPALRFWLDHVVADGGLWEPSGDGVLVVLPPALSSRYGIPEELVVTDDPDIARSDGLSFLGTGHPVVAQAAESVLAGGDAGVLRLDPAARAPSLDVLQARAWDQVPIGHGRIDVAGPPQPAVHWLLRVGALVSYSLSADEQVAEQVERWVHVGSCREVPSGVVDRLARAAVEPAGAAGQAGDGDLVRALAAADRLIEAEAVRRRTDLSGEIGGAHEAERRRAQAYYADAIAGLERRLTNAAVDRRDLLAARLAATREERGRRLAEIAEKYQPRHAVKPYRLHAVGVPAVRLTVDVRRGARRYPMELDWLLPAGVFAQPPCPSCGAVAPLVAGKSGLGCFVCAAPKPAPAVPRPAPAPSPKVRDAPSPPPSTPPSAAPVQAAPVQAPLKKVPTPRAAERLRAVTAIRADHLTESLWNAVAGGESRPLRRLIAPSAPAAVLYDLFGPEAIRVAVAVGAGEQMLSFSAGSRAGADGWATTDGSVRTSAAVYPFTLVWQPDTGGGALAEALPCHLYPDGRFNLVFWRFGGRARRYDAIPSGHVDQVSRLILKVAAPWHGAAVAARAMAAWRRLSDRHAELIDAHSRPVLAAAVHRLVAVRAGDKGLFRESADLFGVDEPRLRAADAQVRKLLALGPGRAW